MPGTTAPSLPTYIYTPTHAPLNSSLIRTLNQTYSPEHLLGKNGSRMLKLLITDLHDDKNELVSRNYPRERELLRNR